MATARTKEPLDLSEAGYLRRRKVVVNRITVIEFGMNDGGVIGRNCYGSDVRADTAKSTNVIIAGEEIWSEKMRC